MSLLQLSFVETNARGLIDLRERATFFQPPLDRTRDRSIPRDNYRRQLASSFFSRSLVLSREPKGRGNIRRGKNASLAARFHRLLHGIRCQFHVKSIRVNAGKKRLDVAAQKQWPVWQLSRPVSHCVALSPSLSLRSWISHENQSRTESFRPVYRINLRPVLVTFAESLAELGGADGSTKKRRRFQPAFRNKNETVGNFALSLARFEIERFAILPSRGLRSRMKEERRTIGLEQEGGSRCRSGITHVLSIPAIPTTRRSSYASLIAVLAKSPPTSFRSAIYNSKDNHAVIHFLSSSLN